ncbi:hypothetical protein FOJ82_07075 [Tessaracoccus rhinocerotis]|uniref:Uncharacterized protein n=1 Tax=Tessaracoccus rhinocerotis TaxID=1689449 RepID=A0A553K2F2_9ACTN|nr:hypothetical protein FOJ82_07075 [Tessaracoccus rhinocerotis]
MKRKLIEVSLRPEIPSNEGAARPVPGVADSVGSGVAVAVAVTLGVGVAVVLAAVALAVTVAVATGVVGVVGGSRVLVAEGVVRAVRVGVGAVGVKCTMLLNTHLFTQWKVRLPRRSSRDSMTLDRV